MGHPQARASIAAATATRECWSPAVSGLDHPTRYAVNGAPQICRARPESDFRTPQVLPMAVEVQFLP
jgi:hypothetical protein